MSNFSYPYSIQRDGLVGEWLLDGDGTDTSGNGNDGTCTDVTWVSADRGYVEECGSFNGSSSRIDYGSAVGNLLKVQTLTFSFETIVKAYPNTGKIMAFFGGDNNNGYYGWKCIILDTGELAFRLTESNGGIRKIYNSGVILEIDKKYYIGITFDSGDVVFNINGQIISITDSTTAVYDSNNYFVIGAASRRSDTRNYLNGEVGNFRVYTKVLSIKELENLRFEGLRKLGPGIVKGDSQYRYYTPSSLPKPVLFINGNHTDDTYRDNSGNGNHGTQNGGVVVNQVGLNKEMLFDGSDDYIQFGGGVGSGTVPSDRLSDYDFTIKYWFKTNSSSGVQQIYGDYIVSTDGSTNKCRGLIVGLKDSNIHGEVCIEGASSIYNILSNQDVEQGKWYMVSYVKEGTNLKLYINGVLDNTVSMSGNKIKWTYSGGTAHTGYKIIGSWKYEGGIIEQYNGNLVSLYTNNKALSDKQIQELYYAEKGNFIN